MPKIKWIIYIISLPVLLSLCGYTQTPSKIFKESAMPIYPPAFMHGNIKTVFNDVFLVTGASITEYNNNAIKKSNNMVIVREGNDLTLINTIRLNEAGLYALEKLGTVKNVIRIGAFHDRNVEFFLNRYKAKLWAVQGMIHANNRQADFLIGETLLTPFAGASFFVFETTSQPEAIIHIAREDGILITCDSIKNWTHVDEYFSESTGKEFLKQGLIAPANIDNVWLHAMNPELKDFERLKKLKFKHLLRAHGQPIIHTADKQLMPILDKLTTSD